MSAGRVSNYLSRHPRIQQKAWQVGKYVTGISATQMLLVGPSEFGPFHAVVPTIAASYLIVDRYIQRSSPPTLLGRIIKPLLITLGILSVFISQEPKTIGGFLLSFGLVGTWGRMRHQAQQNKVRIKV